MVLVRVVPGPVGNFREMMQHSCRPHAYASMLTFHATSATRWKTKIAAEGSNFDIQINLLRTLLRSLRSVERHNCERDFVLLLGLDVKLSEAQLAALQYDGFKLVLVPPLQQGVPTTDKVRMVL